MHIDKTYLVEQRQRTRESLKASNQAALVETLHQSRSQKTEYERPMCSIAIETSCALSLLGAVVMLSAISLSTGQYLSQASFRFWFSLSRFSLLLIQPGARLQLRILSTLAVLLYYKMAAMVQSASQYSFRSICPPNKFNTAGQYPSTELLAPAVILTTTESPTKSTLLSKFKKFAGKVKPFRSDPVLC